MMRQRQRRCRHVTKGRAWLRSTRAAFTAALVLSLAVVSVWAAASPVDSTPDETYHLVSIWCAAGPGTGECRSTNDANLVSVPAEILSGACTIGDASKSASCALAYQSGDRLPAPLSNINAVAGHYPNGYYRLASRLAGGDATASVMAIRLFNGYLLVGLLFAVIALVGLRLRLAVILAWMSGVIPLGLFMIPSVNPTSWAITSAGLAWAATLGLAEARDFGKRVGLAVVLSLCILMAFLSRLDALLYLAIGVGVGLLLSNRVRGLVMRHKRASAAAAVGVVGLLALAVAVGPAAQSSFVTNSFGGFTRGGTDLLFSNLANLPNLWAGSLGTWGLGPLDTGMPAAVWILSIFAASGLVFFGLRRMWRSKALALGVLLAALVAIPVLTLQSRGDPVGQFIQPRYLLPLVITALGVAILGLGVPPFRFSRVQLAALAVAWTAAAGFALHQLLRRYVTGFDVSRWNLNDGAEWWWDMWLSPMAVWLVGVAAFAALAVLVAVYVHRSGRAVVAPRP